AAYWLIQLQISIKLEGSPAHGPSGLLLKEDIFGVLDSGTSLLAVPKELFVQLMSALFREETHDKCSFMLPGAEGQFICLCDEAKINPMTFSFHGLQGKVLDVTLTQDDLMVLAGRTAGGKALCRVGIMPSPSPLPFIILGDVFLRKVYAIHDFQHYQVTLVPESGTSALVSAAAPPELPEAPDYSISSFALTGSLAMAFAAVAALGAFLQRSVRSQELGEEVYVPF
ncbi:unnamed protein product, partial [Polarella glacialis]